MMTGLRPSEALQSIILIKEDYDNYINKNTMLLEHFKYPQYFIRRTKKAYVSVVNKTILDLANNSASLISYMSFSFGTKRSIHDYRINTKYCRKIFATFLRNNGIEQEDYRFIARKITKINFC